MSTPRRYGIRITYVHWATVDGGDDIEGTFEEMIAKAEEMRKKHAPNAEDQAKIGMSVTYEVEERTS